MNKRTKTEEIPTWDETEKRVVESFDLDDVGTSNVVSTWRKDVGKIHAVVDAGEVVYRFTSPKVLDATVAFFQYDIREDRAIIHVKRASNEREMKFMNIRVALGQAQGVFVDDENGERIVSELLAVLRVTKSAKTKMLQELVLASISLAHNNGDKNAEQASWPSGLGDGIQDFAYDLTEFISTNGDEGRELISCVRQDTGFAKRGSKDSEIPQCIKFLAQIVVEVNINNHLPNKVREIGFGLINR